MIRVIHGNCHRFNYTGLYTLVTRLPGRVKTIRIRYAWTRIFFKNGVKYLRVFSKISGYVWTSPGIYRVSQKERNSYEYCD